MFSRLNLDFHGRSALLKKAGSSSASSDKDGGDSSSSPKSVNSNETSDKERTGRASKTDPNRSRKSCSRKCENELVNVVGNGPKDDYRSTQETAKRPENRGDDSRNAGVEKVRRQ